MIFFLFSIHNLCAQVEPISGIVKNQKGHPLVGVTVTEKGTNVSVATNKAGKFSFYVNGLPTVLEISYIGYKRNEVVVRNHEFIIITMNELYASIDDVVVIGYQKQSVKKTTSAVQVILGSTIENMPAPSFESLLQGRVSGVNIQNFTGAPGARNTFTIRGNSTISQNLTSETDLANTLSSPLYIIDGMPLSVTDLSSTSATGTNYVAGININDIESITIQKDAAATAIWGSWGANGVIVIKTKTGKSGIPLIRASYYRGVTDRPSLQKTLLGSAERRGKLAVLSAYANYNQLGTLPQSLTDSLNDSYNNATDWQDLFYTSGNIDNADLSIAGGSEILNYRLSLGYYNEAGIVRSTGFKRYSLRGNFGFTLTPFLRTDFVVSASRMDRKVGLGRSYHETTPLNNAQLPSSFVKLSKLDYDFFYGQYDKGVYDNKTDILNLFSKTYVDIVKGFQYSFEASVQANLDSRNRFQPRELLPNSKNFASSNSSNSYTYNLANVLNYNIALGNHNFVFTGIQSFQYDNFRSTSLLGYNLSTDDIHVVQGVAQKDLSASSNLKNSGLLSYSGQFAYDYKSKYIFNVSYRADGSSRFGKDTKWGYFPSISAAWVASDEEFLKNINFINFLKFRGSWGKSGVLPTDFYAPYNVWNLSTNTYDGQNIATPSYDNPLTVKNLTWSKSGQTNVGFDLTILNSRLTIIFDAYRKIDKDPILTFPFPFYTGYNSLTYNVPMSIYNEGIDLTISSRNFPANHKFQWNTNFNLSFNKNRIGSLPNQNSSFFNFSSRKFPYLLYNVGSPIYQWGQILYKGVYNRWTDIPVNPITGQLPRYLNGYIPVQPGYPIWDDVNGDGDVGIDITDFVPTGDPNPRFTGGLYNDFSYKNFSIGILATFTFGRDIVNTFKSNQFSSIQNNIYNLANQRLPDLDGVDYWTPSKAKDLNYKANFPSISPYEVYFYQYSSFSSIWNENGNYLKLKTLSVGYLLSESFLKKINIGLKKVRFYGLIDNVFTVQASSFIPDAELVSPQGDYIGNSYPLPRKYTIGVEINF